MPITKLGSDSSADLTTISSGALQAFFDTKEQFFYYRQFNNPSRRREFAASFISTVEHFLLVSSEARQVIYELHVRPRTKSTHARSPLVDSQHEWDRFSEFFDPAATTDLTAAKSAYRLAARILHPDTGGNLADMVALNSTFAQLQDMLLLSEAEAALQPNASTERYWGDGTRGDSSFACGFVGPGFWPGSVLQYPRSAHEFEILLRSEALLAAIDIFDEDRHAELALGLSFNPDWVVNADPSWEAFDKAAACERLADILRIAIEATRAVDLPFGLPGLLEVSQNWMKGAIDGWINHGRLSARGSSSVKQITKREENAIDAGKFPFVEEWREKQLRALSNRLDQPGSRADERFQLNHVLQAENAFRRGLVTAARYKTALERLKGKQDELATAGTAIAELSRSRGFMGLEHDPAEAAMDVSIRFVPESIADATFGRWQLASKQACRAYGEAFYRSEKVDGKLKFVRQRLWILLSSLVAHPDRWDVERIRAAAHEIELLERASRAGREGHSGQHAADLHEFLVALAAEDTAARAERLQILSQCACEDFRDSLPEGVKAVIDRARSSGGKIEGSPLTLVIPSPDYYQTAMRSMDDLNNFAAGEGWSDQEYEAQQEGSIYYHKHMQRLSNLMCKAVDIEPAEKKVAKLAPLIRQAIDQAVPLNAAGEWQLGYYIDRLTGAMVRARKYNEAAATLDEYFGLPDAYRRRSVASVEKRLRARLIRCMQESGFV